MKYSVKAKVPNDTRFVDWEIEAVDIEDAYKMAYKLANGSMFADPKTVEVIPVEEDKQAICDKLVEVLRLTRNLYDLIYLHYDTGREVVVAHFPGGNKIVNVAMDSGTAMIRDIIKGIV